MLLLRKGLTKITLEDACNIAFFFSYHMRRVTCPEHGVVTEEVAPPKDAAKRLMCLANARVLV